MRKTVFKIIKGKERTSCMVEKGIYYKKGEIARADEHTLGVFVFKTRRAARRFYANMCYRLSRGRWQICRAIPIGRGKTPKRISGFIDSRLLRRFYEQGIHSKENKVKGSICYPAIRMID